MKELFSELPPSYDLADGSVISEAVLSREPETTDPLVDGYVFAVPFLPVKLGEPIADSMLQLYAQDKGLPEHAFIGRL